MSAQTAAEQDRERWFLLLDPRWSPLVEEEDPPLEVIAGAWPVEDDGEIGVFQPNPGYDPIDLELPTDPIDSVLREIPRGRGSLEQVRELLEKSLVYQAMSDEGEPLVVEAPDGTPCLVLATSAPHAARTPVPAWRYVDFAKFLESLTPDLDVGINPEGPGGTWLAGGFIRGGTEAESGEGPMTAGRESSLGA